MAGHTLFHRLNRMLQ